MATTVSNLVKRRSFHPRPVIHRLGIDIVHGCQLRCIGCPNSVLNPKISFMSVEDFDLILRNIDAASVKRFRVFNFGEPLLHPNLPDMLFRIGKQGYPVRTVEVSTNAQHHDFPVLAEAFKTGVISELAVSCDGDGTPEEYERLRPPGKYSKLMEFLATARELRDRFAPHVRLSTRSICNSQEGRKRWSDILTPMGWTPEFRDWYHLPGSRRSKENETGMTVKRGCHFMREKYLFVDADGTVVPCCVHPRAFTLGNLREQKYSEILAGAETKARSRELSRAKADMPICGDCPY